jgi:hypothetical protein
MSLVVVARLGAGGVDDLRAGRERSAVAALALPAAPQTPTDRHSSFGGRFGGWRPETAKKANHFNDEWR